MTEIKMIFLEQLQYLHKLNIFELFIWIFQT